MKSNMYIPKFLVWIAWLILQVYYFITGQKKMMSGWEWHEPED